MAARRRLQAVRHPRHPRRQLFTLVHTARKALHRVNNSLGVALMSLDPHLESLPGHAARMESVRNAVSDASNTIQSLQQQLWAICPPTEKPKAGNTASPSPRPSAPPAVRSDRMRVLIVDDGVTLTQTLGDWLGTQGCIIEHAATVAEGRYRLEAEDYALVILDRNLPDGDGFDLAAVCRQLCSRTFVVLTSGDGVDYNSLLKKGYADYFLPKPASIALLRDMLLLARRHAFEPV